MRVVRVDGDRAWVEPVGGCGPCAAGRGCGAQTLARAFGVRRRELPVANTLRAAAGETVIVGVDEGAVTRAAWYLYGLPLGALFAGGLVMHAVAGWIGVADADPLVIAGAVAAFAAALGLARARLRGAGAAPVMLRRAPLGGCAVVL